MRERSARALSFSETHPDLADSLFVVTVLTEVESRTAQNDKLHQLTTMGKPMTCDTRPDDAHAGSTRGLSTRSTEVS